MKALLAVVLAASWPLFGYDTARHNVGTASGITAATVAHLTRQEVRLDGTVDSSPIMVNGTIFVTTTYGRTEAIDSQNGSVKWRFTPVTYSSYAGSPQITNASPAADPSGTAIYAASPDGVVRKLRATNGRVLWQAKVTRDPTREKLTSSINVAHGLVIVTTGGYIGDAPPYQGHVVTLFAKTGRIDHVWNSLCSNQRVLITPSTCPASDSAIWSRNGAAVDPANGNLVVATGNGPYDGKTNWGDSVVILSPDASRQLGHWTPPNQAQLNSSDADLGSTSPAFLPKGFAVQGGKDGVLRLLQLHGQPHLVQSLSTPGGADLFSEPAVWQGKWVFVADSAGTQAWRFFGGRLHAAWTNANDGTSPVVAGGLLYIAGNGAVRVYLPTSGRLLATLQTGAVHWQSPIVAGGVLAMPEGNANDHVSNGGILDLYR